MVSVRSSKYRHVYGDPTRKDKCFDNIRLTKNAFDANLAKSNGKFVSSNWDASGGGSFAVSPISELGKLPDRFPLFDGHKGPVLDTDWNPFDETMVVSASDDGTIGVWRVPEDFSVHVDYGALDDCKDIEPVKFLEGHGKKVGHVQFNPVAKDILASASLDNTVKVWNLETGEVLFNSKHPSFVTSFAWNYDGTKIATVAKDKKSRIWDARAEKLISEGKGHAGAKGSRVVWLGDNDRVLTTGFSLVSDREMAVWDTNDVEKGPIGGFRGLDPSSGIVIPHYDPMTSMVYLGGRGDGKIVYYEYADDNLYDLFAYNSTSPQRGLGWIPNLRSDPRNHEVARVYKVHETLVEPISFKVPLKNEGFLDNVYGFVEVDEPALTADEWRSGKTARPLVRNWKDIYDGKSTEAFEAPVAERKASSPPDPTTQSANSSPRKSASGGSQRSVKEDSKPESAGSPKVSGSSSSSASPAPKQDISDSSRDNKASASSSSEEKIAALRKAEKQDSYDVSQSKEVKSFLAKNSESSDEPEEKDTEDSAWGDEKVSARDVKSKQTEAKKQQAETKKDEPKKVEPKKEPKKEEPKKEEPKKEEPKKEQPKKEEPKKEEPKKNESAKPESAKEEKSKDTSSKAKAGDASTKTDIKKEESKAESAPRKVAEPAVSGTASTHVDNAKLNLISEKLDDSSARLSKLEAKSP